MSVESSPERTEPSAVTASATATEVGDLLERSRGADGRIDLSGQCLAGVDLSGIDLSFAKLSGTNLSRANLTDARLDGADLSSAELGGARLEGASLVKANLSEADLGDVEAQRAAFGGANLVAARLLGGRFDRASFVGADLTGADIRAASCRRASFREACFVRADLSRADLRFSQLESLDVDRATFRGADLRHSHVSRISSFATADWLSCEVAGVDFCNAYLTRREIHDQNYLDEFRKQSRMHEAIYRLWWITSDCGRSIMRWTAWIAVLVLIYGVIYATLSIDYGDYETSLSPFYFSVVTLTTLGYGDVLPASLNAQIAAMSQVVFGYICLGGLLSIFANKMTRRAD